MCICAVHEYWFWIILAMVMLFSLWTVYLIRKEREYDRNVASLERENDKLEIVIYELESTIFDLEEKLENESQRFKATINLLEKNY